MKWILEHLQLIFVIGGAIAWWLNQRRQAQEPEEGAPPEEETFADPELAERTRKIREEIQRKIEQRARGHAGPQPPAESLEPPVPPMIVREVVVVPPKPPVVTRHAASHAEAQRTAEILEQQAALAAQLQQAQAMKAAAARRTEFEAQTASPETASATTRAAMAGILVEDLRSPSALRRAFLLREILGPPMALRR